MLGIYQLSVIGPIAVGALAAGALAEVVGIRWSLGACALGLALWGSWSLTHRVPAIDGPAPGDARRAPEGAREMPTRPAAPAPGGTARGPRP